ncbi:hypothetical protein, partial [Rhizobium leguminosarum]|uniref:hypothetical protein n=1 Tax=Rhizobium leguminosarum TaxID=384 RepID=UPI003F99EC05
IVFRFVDVNNWISWTPNNVSTGRLRVRVAGVNYDVAVPLTTVSANDLYQVALEGPSIRMFRNTVLIASATEPRLMSGTIHGVSS